MMAGTRLLAADEPYKGFAEDAKLLRDTTAIPSGDKQIMASTGKAQDASKRIFSKLPFLFKTRDEVLQLLGDPATISGYGKKAGTEKDAPLIYNFDNGYGGPIYTLTFHDGKVTGVMAGSSE